MVLVELGLAGMILAIILLVVAILIIVFVVGTLIAFLPATLVGILVWWWTGDFITGAIAFLIVALIMIIFRK